MSREIDRAVSDALGYRYVGVCNAENYDGSWCIFIDELEGEHLEPIIVDPFCTEHSPDTDITGTDPATSLNGISAPFLTVIPFFSKNLGEAMEAFLKYMNRSKITYDCDQLTIEDFEYSEVSFGHRDEAPLLICQAIIKRSKHVRARQTN